MVPERRGATSFLRLDPGADRYNWTADVNDDVVVGNPAQPTLYGGAGLGFALQALERAVERPVICATAQFLTFAYKGAGLQIEVTPAKAGFQITQAQAQVRSGDQDVLFVTAALGTRRGKFSHQWAAPHRAPAPGDCAPIHYHWHRAKDDMHSRLDVRVVPEGGGSGTGAPDGRFWIRSLDPAPVDSAFLAVLGDFVPTALGSKLGPSRMSSLDNTIRIFGAPQTEWLLCETRFLRAAQGLAHGEMLMFDETGTLIASASQSVIVRV